MIHISAVRQGILEVWVAHKIADLAGTLPASQAGLLLLDAQITDLETRCAIRQDGNDHKCRERKSKHGSPLNHDMRKTARTTATKN